MFLDSFNLIMEVFLFYLNILVNNNKQIKQPEETYIYRIVVIESLDVLKLKLESV